MTGSASNKETRKNSGTYGTVYVACTSNNKDVHLKSNCFFLSLSSFSFLWKQVRAVNAAIRANVVAIYVPHSINSSVKSAGSNSYELYIPYLSSIMAGNLKEKSQ